MTVGELMHGRGTLMSAHELGVLWPAFYRCQARIAKREEERRADQQNRAARRRR